MPALVSPSLISSEKLLPVKSRIALSKSVPVLLASVKNCLIPAAATDVLTPCEVISAIDAATSANSTPIAAACGSAVDSVPASSSNVVLPSLTALNIISAASAADIFSEP